MKAVAPDNNASSDPDAISTVQHSFRPTPVPIRIDVTSDDKNVRIIETLLVDPTCWPIPLYSPLRQAVEANVQEYAYTLLSDMEVHGMGRTVRHFTGRVDLYTAALQTKIEDQLRPQLWAIATGDVPKPKESPTKISIRLNVHGIAIHEDILWDCTVPLSPFDFAKDLAKEWNLPDETVVAIATTILEQLYDLPMDSSPDFQATTSTSGATSTFRRGAWMTETKENIAFTGQITADHNQQPISTSSS